MSELRLISTLSRSNSQPLQFQLYPHNLSRSYKLWVNEQTEMLNSDGNETWNDIYLYLLVSLLLRYIKFIIIVGSQNLITNTILAARVKLCPAGAWLVLSVISWYPRLSWHHTQTYFILLPWLYCINAIITYRIVPHQSKKKTFLVWFLLAK